jgi:hypothetical protein
MQWRHLKVELAIRGHPIFRIYVAMDVDLFHDVAHLEMTRSSTMVHQSLTIKHRARCKSSALQKARPPRNGAICLPPDHYDGVLE